MSRYHAIFSLKAVKSNGLHVGKDEQGNYVAYTTISEESNPAPAGQYYWPDKVQHPILLVEIGVANVNVRPGGYEKTPLPKKDIEDRPFKKLFKETVIKIEKALTIPPELMKTPIIPVEGTLRIIMAELKQSFPYPQGVLDAPGEREESLSDIVNWFKREHPTLTPLIVPSHCQWDVEADEPTLL